MNLPLPIGKDMGRCVTLDEAGHQRNCDLRTEQVTLVFLMMLASDRELMGQWANARVTNILGTLVIVFIALCAAGYGIISFLQTIGLIPA